MPLKQARKIKTTLEAAGFTDITIAKMAEMHDGKIKSLGWKLYAWTPDETDYLEIRTVLKYY